MAGSWSGTGLSQQELMLKDQCLVVDGGDNIIGHSSKELTHKFLPSQPQGVLHRAFSVFLFSPDNKLLLQRRAKSKVTFPAVWTNTCCSHPLFGQSPDEVDGPETVASGVVPGVVHAAVRKLQHELGIQPSQLPADSFKYLTRLHYCARDVGTWGPDAEWGEHEIDYILFIRAQVDVTPNPAEVDAIKYVTLPELQQMMAPSSGLLWSPWFRIIADRFLERWWSDLDTTLTTDKHCDWQTIHKIL